MTPSQENEILRFLRDDVSTRLDKLQVNHEQIVGNQQRLGNEFLLMRSSVEADLKVFGHRLSCVEARVGNLERDQEVTGQHNIDELKKQIDQKRDTTWKVIGLVAAFGGGSVVSLILSLLMHR